MGMRRNREVSSNLLYLCKKGQNIRKFFLPDDFNCLDFSGEPIDILYTMYYLRNTRVLLNRGWFIIVIISMVKHICSIRDILDALILIQECSKTHCRQMKNDQGSSKQLNISFQKNI